jgi:hypothetical protein
MTTIIEGYWKIFAEFYFNFYSPIILLLLLLCSFSKMKLKTESYNWLYTLNTSIALISLVNLSILLFVASAVLYGQSNSERFTFMNSTDDPISKYLFWVFILNGVLPSVFLIKKLRTSRILSFIVLLLLNSGMIKNWVYDFFRDYLPSSWSVYYSESLFQKLFKWLFLLGILALVYRLSHKRKKLPYPSAIFPYFLFFISYSLFHCIPHSN